MSTSAAVLTVHEEDDRPTALHGVGKEPGRHLKSFRKKSRVRVLNDAGGGGGFQGAIKAHSIDPWTNFFRYSPTNAQICFT